MPGRILRTPDALQDLDDIWDYIAQDSVTAADKLLDQLQGRFEVLAANPELGELQPLLVDGTYRRFCFRKYVIYYHPLEDGIVLVRVLHGSREHDKLM
jgi:toxin ParE1/3/4